MFEQAAVLGQLDADLDAALAAGLAFGDSRDAVEVIRRVESIRRKAAALAVGLLAELDRSQVFRGDGHSSAKTMVRHVGRLSACEAAALARGVRMGQDLPGLVDALAAGSLGVEQFDLLGRVHANPRVRAAMAEAQGWFLPQAERLSYADFELAVRQWERLVDADGAEPANTGGHDARNVTLVQDHFELGWQLRGTFAAMQGAAIHEIFEHYIEAELLADWQKARAEHGDEATAAQLPRAAGQRRADALWQIFHDAAAADHSVLPAGFVHNIVWDAATYQQMLARLDGEEPQPLDVDSYRCETLDGVPLEPVEAAASSLADQVRRVVVDAAGVVIDMGRARFFTGNARTAVQLADTHCPWPGCPVAASHCEIDHTIDHAHGGRTNPGNGGPFCGRHNRWKQKGFTVWRDPTGQWHIHRPDGTKIE